MLRFINCKSTHVQNVKFLRFERILNHSTKKRKFAKYEGLYYVLSPLLTSI